ncbi:hypothetical protein M405DRAFT_826120 [Rhizopogon salebrosus TDB-379]|nr:hypothetical protein M405DRAFT_826120 [Rhizopogon salebrosus TDB-379]
MSFNPNPTITHSPLPSPGLPPEMPPPSPKGSILNVPLFCASVIDDWRTVPRSPLTLRTS